MIRLWDVCPTETSWFSSLGKQTKLGQIFSCFSVLALASSSCCAALRWVLCSLIPGPDASFQIRNWCWQPRLKSSCHDFPGVGVAIPAVTCTARNFHWYLGTIHHLIIILKYISYECLKSEFHNFFLNLWFWRLEFWGLGREGGINWGPGLFLILRHFTYTVSSLWTHRVAGPPCEKTGWETFCNLPSWHNPHVMEQESSPPPSRPHTLCPQCFLCHSLLVHTLLGSSPKCPQRAWL